MKQTFKPLILVLLTLLPATALAHDFEVNGIYYNIVNNSEASVTYRGTSHHEYSNEYTGSLTIPSTVAYNGTTYPVTAIGREAFASCIGVINVNIPNSVTTIGMNAFNYCIELTNVNIPNSVTSIGGGAFFYCKNLISIDIPNSVTSIGDEAFLSCLKFTRIVIPNSVTSIGDDAFGSCRGLVSVLVDSGNTKYDSRDNCNAIIESSTNTLIAGCMNTLIPHSVTTIGDYAFRGCHGLTSITIPNTVTSIGVLSFQGCKFTNITIPNSVTTIGGGAFENCTELTSVTCLATTPPAINSNYYAFPSDVTSQATLYVPRGSVAAFQAATNWQDFSQIVGLPRIDDFEVDGVWYRAIEENTAMVISRPGEELYSGDVVIPEAVTCEGYTFTVIGIDEGAFEDCYELNSVVIGDAVESIGDNAFQGCTGLTSVTIGSGVTNIGAKAFNYCNALQTVTCMGTVPPVMASSNCFTNAAYSRAVLKVPRPEIETYAAADYWYKFNNIQGWGYLGPGDVNGSGTIDMDDLTRLINIMLTDNLDGIDPSWADVTGNGIVSMNDLTELINILLTQ